MILCEDKFEYRDLQVKPGELLGMDDAVFITGRPSPVWTLPCAMCTTARKVVHLDGIKRVRLPAPAVWLRAAKGAGGPHEPHRAQVSAAGVRERLVLRLRRLPPTEEDTVYCSECGCDRILLQNALNTLLQPAAPAPQMEARLRPRLLPQRPLRWRSLPASWAQPLLLRRLP